MSDAPAPERPAGWLTQLLNPSSVAVVGASESPRSPGFRIVTALQRYGFAGPVYPVNPGRDTVLGLPCFPSLSALPEPPDVAIVVVSAGQSV